MPSRIVNNIGTGKVEMTFMNCTTTVAATLLRPVVQADIDAGRDAVTLSTAGYVGIATTTTGLFGACLAVSEELFLGKTMPSELVVQTKGVALLNGTTTLPQAMLPTARHNTARGGKIADAGQTTAALVGTRGTAVEVFDTDRVAVLF
jgi:hypothetical protein